MEAVAVLVFVLLALGVAALVSAPLRNPRLYSQEPAAERAELEAAREAKYREIRDTEMDYRTGKLSESDYHELDRDLRGEAVEILRRLDALGR